MAPAAHSHGRAASAFRRARRFARLTSMSSGHSCRHVSQARNWRSRQTTAAGATDAAILTNEPAGPRGLRLTAGVNQGRSIWQVVGTSVSFAAILPFEVQPQPVPSSSNFWPGFSGPNERRYMSWKNW